MDINLTLLGQAITFALFVWFTMKFVWPPITQALEERKQKIADGLAAAESGVRQLDQAKQDIAVQMKDARAQAHQILEEARHRAAQIEEEGKTEGRQAAHREVQLAHDQIAQAYLEAQKGLSEEATHLALGATRKMLAHLATADLHEEMVRGFIKDLNEHV